MKRMTTLIYRIWIQREIKEAEENFFEVAVWDELEKQYIESLGVTSLKTLSEAMEKLQQVIEAHPHILFKPNPSGRILEDR